MSVVAFESKKDKNEKQHKEHLLEILGYFQKKIEPRKIQTFQIH